MFRLDWSCGQTGLSRLGHHLSQQRERKFVCGAGGPSGANGGAAALPAAAFSTPCPAESTPSASSVPCPAEKEEEEEEKEKEKSRPRTPMAVVVKWPRKRGVSDGLVSAWVCEDETELSSDGHCEASADEDMSFLLYLKMMSLM